MDGNKKDKNVTDSEALNDSKLKSERETAEQDEQRTVLDTVTDKSSDSATETSLSWRQRGTVLDAVTDKSSDSATETSLSWRQRDAAFRGQRGTRADSAFGRTTNWRQPGCSELRRMIPNEGEFQEYRNPNSFRGTQSSYYGKWTVKCGNEFLDENGKTEADYVWKALSELHAENPMLFKAKKIIKTGVVIISCLTYSSDEENILKVAQMIRQSICYPYAMYYFSFAFDNVLYMYTPDGEVYDYFNLAFKFKCICE